MNKRIQQKERRVRPIQLIFRLISYLVLRVLDGRVKFYMKLQIAYLEALGVRIKRSPLYICADVKLDSSDFSLITIGKNVVISSEVRILTHDYTVTKALKFVNIEMTSDIRKLAPVNLEENCFIGMRSIILPGVTIGKNSIIGAGSVVTKNIVSNVVAAGNPAKIICSIEDYSDKIQKEISHNHSLYFKN